MFLEHHSGYVYSLNFKVNITIICDNTVVRMGDICVKISCRFLYAVKDVDPDIYVFIYKSFLELKIILLLNSKCRGRYSLL